MRVFKKQEEALSERKETEFTFAVNYENSKACFFVNATEEDFWYKYMAVGPRNNYEKILADKPCHLSGRGCRDLLNMCHSCTFTDNSPLSVLFKHPLTPIQSPASTRVVISLKAFLSGS